MSLSETEINHHLIQGPIPLTWVVKGNALGVKAGNLILLLFYKKGLVKNATFKLSNNELPLFNITRATKTKLLKKFEELGLVRLHNKSGQSVVVEMLETNIKRTQ